MSSEAPTCLIVRSAEQLYALPLAHVESTMRPLPVKPVLQAPAFVLGVSVIGGLAVPVVDVAAVAGSGLLSPRVGRFVTLKLGERRVALAIDEVLGVHAVDRHRLSALPPLLGVAEEEVVSAIGRLDDELLLVLGSARLLPDDVWTALDTGGLH